MIDQDGETKFIYRTPTLLGQGFDDDDDSRPKVVDKIESLINRVNILRKLEDGELQHWKGRNYRRFFNGGFLCTVFSNV